jgi:hypothetical protein
MKRRKRRSSLRSVAKFDQGKEVKAIARERVGRVKPARVIVPKKQRGKPKHKKPPGTEE